jgi:hypothetical protein
VGEDSTLIELVTRCDSADEFIERFARFTTETDVVVPAVPHVRVGSAGKFTIRLKDRSAIMTGQCEVVEMRSVAVAPGADPAGAARALMRLRVAGMDARSCGIHLRLMERHAAASKPAPPPAPVVKTPARSLTLVPPLAVVPPPAPVAAREAPVPPVAPVSPPPPSTIHVMSIPRPPALRNAPGPAAIAPAPTLAPSDAIVAAMASSSESEPTEVSPSPRQEVRVEGAAFTLPANPLSDLDAADLSSFVDLTLLETNTAAEGPSDAAVARARHIGRRVAPYAACVLGGLLLGMVFKPGSKPAPTPSSVTGPTPVAVPAAPPPSPTVQAAPAPQEATQAPAADRCVASVTTTPPGATVSWGGVELGASPIERAAIPCGPAVVTLRHERYAEVTRTVRAQRGQDAVIAERLSRPPAKLVVVSSPLHAVIKLNDRRFGPTPRRIGTLRFEHVRIQASLPGYQPWRKTVYLKDAETKVEVKLAPVPKPTPRRAAPAASGAAARR